MSEPRYTAHETLHDGAEVLVTRGRLAAADGDLPVVVKALRNPDNATRQARLQYEFGMLTKLQAAGAPGILQPVRLLRNARQAALVAQDMGGYSLRALQAQTPLHLDEILLLAPRVCAALSAMHRARVTHKDVNPSNIVCERSSLQVQLIDFEIASELSHESQWMEATRGFHGTPAYASPEQTGRMNRVLDWRTDLYSWGVSLYEMIGGQLPFDGDMAELMYAILAREPPPLESLNGACPPQLARIVARLMAKAPEQRYQSAQGAGDDLQACVTQWQAHGRIEAFDLGRTDRRERFELAETLHGRGPQVQALQDAYQRAAQGRCEVLWLAGPSGIGKSALVGEVQRLMMQHGAVLLSGKYDQLRRHVPFNAFTLAVAAFVRRVLVQPQTVVDAWRLVLGGALGNIGQALVDIAPALTALMGAQKTLHDGGPQATENRFILALQRFLVALSTHQPLVLFLDDLQWADSGTFKLLANLLSGDCGQAGLLLIGAYRDNEVDAAHPLRAVLNRVVGERSGVSSQAIGALQSSDIAALIAEASHASAPACAALAALVREKTGGNPFFVREFLQALARKDLFTYAPEQRAWRWDLAAVRAAHVTDNVAQLMGERLSTLPEAARQVMSYAAALGNEFSLANLAMALQKERLYCAEQLTEPLQMGLVVALGDNYRYAAQTLQEVTYKFAHDQVQQAAYRLLSDTAAPQCHAQIARRFLATHSEAEVSTGAMSVLGHLNRAAALLTPAERAQAAHLNHLGALEAKKSTAYSIAVDCLHKALEFLGGQAAWEQQRDLVWELHLELAQCSLLINDKSTAERANALALQWAQSPTQRARAHRIHCEALSTMGQPQAAVKTGLLGLQAMGMQFDENAGVGGVVTALLALQVAMIGRRVEDLVNLPPMRDARMSEMMALLTTLALPVFFFNPFLFARMALIRARLSIRYGATSGTPHALAMVGVAYSTIGNYTTARRYSQASIDSAARMPFAENGPSLDVVYHLFCNHAREAPAVLAQSCQDNGLLSLEAGSPSEAWTIVMSGAFLEMMIAPQACAEHAAAWAKTMPINGQQERCWMDTALAGPRCLLGETPSLLLWQATAAEDAAFDAVMAQPEAGQATMGYSAFRGCTHWLGRDLAGALRLMLRARDRGSLEKMGDQTSSMVAVWSLLAVSDYRLYFPATAETPDPSAVKTLGRAAWRKLRTVARDGPTVYGGVIPWIQAQEAAAGRGQRVRAAALYETATRALAKSGYACFVAAAHECAARFYAVEQHDAAMHGHLMAALDGYEAWGARAKVAQLRHEFGSLTRLGAHGTTVTTTTLTDSVTADQVNLAAILNLTQALGGETSEDGLVHRVIDTLVANAGATRAIFVACNRDGLQVVYDSAPDALGIPLMVLELARRSREAVVLDDPAQAGDLQSDPYIAQTRPGAVLCAPVLRQGAVPALIYLENRLTARAFTPAHLILVQVLAAQAALSLQSARLLGNLEAEVGARTREVQTMHEKMVNLEKASTETHLAGGFAHEMRNALHPASITLDTAFESPDLNLGQAVKDLAVLTAVAPVALQPELTRVGESLHFAQQAMETATRAVNRALHITEQILEFASVGSLHAGDEHVLALRVVQRLQLEFAERLQALHASWEVDIPADLHLAVKEDHIHTVLRNLLANACDALEGRAPASLSVRARQLEGDVRIEVADTGRGMPAEVQRRLFEPFFSTKGARGTGLGLGLSRRLMLLYGGNLEVTSTLREGTTVAVVLPRVQRA